MEIQQGDFADITQDTSFVVPERLSEDNSHQSPRFPSRKVHSAAATSNGFGLNDILDDIPRPYTAAGVDEYPSRQRKKKSVGIKKTARDSKTPRKDRPRSAGVNEWGDFDTDRLLRDDFEEAANQMPPDSQDRQRSRSRKSRRSSPASSSPPANPWEGYLTLTNESKESSKPPMQVLRQKAIEILNLDFVTQGNQSSSRASVTPKPLISRASMERLLSSHSRPATSHTSSQTPLFGTEIQNTSANRAVIFGRFADLWSLISRYRSSDFESTDNHTKSAVECNTVMVKLCKTVGISLTSSVATRLSFWNTNDQGVDFESFCDLVLQGAIQPALHHFNLDNSMAEYVAALDTIIQSLATTEPTRRLKQLNEIQPVFRSWKAGISPRLIQSAEVSTMTPINSVVTAEKVRKALEASASQHMLAHQLPSEEARVTRVENIRRKVQLHKSWKCSSDEKLGVSSPITQLSRGGLNCSDGQRISTSKAADLAEMLDRARIVFPTSAGSDLFPQDEDQPEHPTQTNDPEKEIEADNEEVIVCCSCSVRAAELWCASCFTVNCQKCWQDVHFCTVDMSVVSSGSSARKPLLGPTALGMKKLSGSATLRPPVSMVYLPTKAMVSGTLVKGVRHIRNTSNQVNALKDEVPAVTANAILPSLHKSRSSGTIPRHYHRPQVENIPTRATDSTAYSTLGNQSTGSHRSTGLQKHDTPSRSKLHLAPVSIDAELLLSTTLDRRR
ncbi:hypothetical protein F441_10688 [Phytophthora nicotianae CJ01A1]|uniref:B box-type domain-containing protein n=2 Tax=Phytophthora nicotianae TaxID=4792 RepID=W2IWQ1_PHYNI|nr:hypothetical protein L915_10501 [Phytophthora nicotianae]ETL37972.1 hypothetical protein L916_10394 [Phytophthora nicotianae]ETP14364.1 hypothetical protein F441_10688 [Phytophthora nicotianae CJ01A1]